MATIKEIINEFGMNGIAIIHGNAFNISDCDISDDKCEYIREVRLSGDSSETIVRVLFINTCLTQREQIVYAIDKSDPRYQKYSEEANSL